MLNHATEEPGDAGGDRAASGVGPALAWAVGGGAVVLALAVLLYVVALSAGEWLAGTPQQAMPRLASAPMYREFGGLFVAAVVAIFVARAFGVRTR